MDIVNMSLVKDAQELDNNDHDAFYAELERQVLTLIDDHDQIRFFSDTHKYSSSSLSTKRRLNIVEQTSNYFYWNDTSDDHSVPAWISNLWGNNNNKGTGVFIPRIVGSRSKNKPRRKNNSKAPVYKTVEVEGKCIS